MLLPEHSAPVAVEEASAFVLSIAASVFFAII
jgi:hypothetical protein